MKWCLFRKGFLIMSVVFLFQNVVAENTFDRQPKYKGNIQKTLNRNLRYPYEEFLNHTEGVVSIMASINVEGKIQTASVEKGVSDAIDAEALRVVYLLNKWKLAEENGNKIEASIMINVEFKLSDDQLSLLSQIKPLTDNGKNPLFVIDGKAVKGIANIEYYNVKSIRVMKGEKAIALYGASAKYGVVIIETKRGTEPVYQMY